MSNTPYKINTAWITGLVIILILVNLIYAGHFMGDAYPGHNMISNLAMAAAPMHHIGLPYKDYWDIYPPGIYLFLSPFEYFFHGQTMVFKLAHILFAILIGLIVLKFLIRIFRHHAYQAIQVTLFFALYLLLSNYYYCILFHNAFLALFVSACGLYLLAFSKKAFLKYFLSSVLFAFSASMKETYLFTALLPLLYLCSRYLFRQQKSYRLFGGYSVLVSGGILLVFCVNYWYLEALGVTGYYREVSAYKTGSIGGNSFEKLFNTLNPFNVYDFSLQFKELSGSFFVHSYGIIYCLYFFIFLFLFIPIKFRKENGRWKKSWISCTRERGMGLLFTGFFLLNFEGFKLLHKYQPNYTLQMVPAYILVFAYLFHSANKTFQQLLKNKYAHKTRGFKNTLNLLLICCFAWLAVPRFSDFKFFRFMPPAEYIAGLSLKKPEVVLPAKVKQAMGNDRRILYIYGWGTPYFYYFSNTQPFSKFFILHPSILGDEQLHEFVEQFKTGLPKVVLYTEEGADMDIVEFEANTIHFKQLLQECYEFYPAEMYPGFHCKGYYLLKNEAYFKTHSGEFIAPAYSPVKP